MNWYGLKLQIYMLILGIHAFCAGGKQYAKEPEQHSGRYKINRIGTLPAVIDESSGLILADSISFWTHNDGNDGNLYRINLCGDLLETKPTGLIFRDFEDLTKDNRGNLYLADIGNNQNNRKDLAIYIFNPKDNSKTGSIFFSYPEQTAFPPVSQRERNFDCEALFWFQDSLYLISKNRGDKEATIYSLPATAGTYSAKPKAKFLFKEKVTAAALSPDNKTFVVLTYGFIYFFRIENGAVNFDKPLSRHAFNRAGQSEAITYINENQLLISNEQGKLFVMEQKSGKPKQ